jgi:hypothetical protein
MKKLIAALLSVFVLGAQEGSTVNITDGPKNQGYQKAMFYSGANLEYVCSARSNSRQTTGSISAATNANPVELTSTSHQFYTYSKPTITISGGTGAWAAINGRWTITVTGANTFTIGVDSTAFGALAGTIVFTTLAPRLDRGIWAIQKFTYDGSSNLTGAFWAGDPAAASGASSAETKACSARTTLSYQ